ncbi:MAG TPA: diaminopimelate epimerase [Longimicrobiaceae bacterium]|nr:diaminopimelate epimerase [Longimicrobiaceae bacterium]
MPKVVFFKGHGLGNDYLALRMADLPFELSPPAVRLLCDRHTGVGSDGILAMVPSDTAQFGVRIFNPDGSEAEKSGNGQRIFAAYLYDRWVARVGEPFTVETPGGTVTLQILGTSPEGVFDVEAEMGTAVFRSAAAGMTGPDRDSDGEVLELDAGDRVEAAVLSMGNPHCVVFADELDPEDLCRRAPQLSRHPSFERGTNVQFARVAGPGVVEALVWERGAGETLASGSSACAVAAAAVRRGLVAEREVEVRMPGGTLRVTVREDWSVLLRGPVEGVYRGELLDGMLRRLGELSWP